MGWNRTDYDGRTCYERNGQRLFSTEEIDALDRFEKEQSKKRKSDFKEWQDKRITHEANEYEPNEHDPVSTMITLVVLVGLALLFLFSTK